MQQTKNMHTEFEAQVEDTARKDLPKSPEKLSYAAMTARGSSLNKNPPVKMPEEEIFFQEGDVTMDSSGDFPRISFSKRIHDLIDRNMKQVIITRLLGKKIGYKALMNRIQMLWMPIGNFNLIDLDNDYYLVKFENIEDYTRVLTDGPWMIFGSYLTVQPWSRNFNTSEKHPSQVIAWLRLPRLPYRYYNSVLIRTIANTIERAIKIDYNTKVGESGKFVRIAVVIDLNNPLIPCVGIDDFIQKIEYEEIQQICFNCGIYGHAKEVFQSNQEDKHINVNSNNNTMEEQSNVEKSKENPFGPWMFVQPRGRNNRYQRTQNKLKRLKEHQDKDQDFPP
ncbi:uncharacterized protein LOC120202198 [Hibiscus syriacus]|uniref:uncharacterized protein LOC120202198 n=1 Tax=Hibiscus syriacus TaxID=106335 RepID=UPI0019214B5C|nr:uncharacterized protein LOC120202198 [Hibiscus syriacus]